MPDAVDRELYTAAARATLSASIHNTQPWRFVVRDGILALYVEPTRQLDVLDHDGRQLVISCGAALFGARMALAAARLETVVRLSPDPADPDLLATVEVVGVLASADLEAVRLDLAAQTRQSNRRRFADGVIPAPMVARLTQAADLEGGWLQPVTELDDRVAVAALSQRADSMENADAAYRSELREWTSSDAGRDDGVPASAVPHVTGAQHDDVPIRDFDTQGKGQLPTETRSSLSQTMVILGTTTDSRYDWLVAGQALGRVLLEIASNGYAVTLMSQVIEMPATRQQLRAELRIFGHPQMLLRIGTAEPTPRTRRRPLSETVFATKPGQVQR